MSLYTQCFRSALLPALDVLNGTRVAQIYNELLESQWLPLERHEAAQRRKLDDLLGWTKANAPFYEKHWAQAPAHARASSLYPQLDGIPVVTKPERGIAISRNESTSTPERTADVRSGSPGKIETRLPSFGRSVSIPCGQPPRPWRLPLTCIVAARYCGVPANTRSSIWSGRFYCETQSLYCRGHAALRRAQHVRCLL